MPLMTGLLPSNLIDEFVPIVVLDLFKLTSKERGNEKTYNLPCELEADGP